MKLKFVRNHTLKFTQKHDLEALVKAMEAAIILSTYWDNY